MNRTSYDMVIIGGGLAGSALATPIARAGYDVLILEKERSFRDRVRGEFLAPWGVRNLRRLDLLDTLREAGAIDLPALAGRSLKPRPVQSPDGDAPLSFSHTAAQEALLRKAQDSGAEVIRGAKVTEIEGNSVSFRTPDGDATVTARLIVGADGRTSLARRVLGHREHVHRSARVLAGVLLENVPQDPSFGYFVIREEAGGLVSLFPQSGGRARAYVFIEGNDTATYTGPNGYDNFVQSMIDLGVPAEALEGARPAGPLAAFVGDDSWVRHPAAGHLVLVGDAAGISDPTWGQGMALAFHDARVLSQELLRHRDWRAGAHRFARERDRYFHTIITAESWLTELQLTPGEAASERRAHVIKAWRAEPERAAMLDLNGRGPALEVSKEARRKVFAEDLPRGFEAPAQKAAPAQPGVAATFLGALRDRDFETLASLITDTARVRALLPGGPVEITGAQATASAFYHWFGDVEEFELLDTTEGSMIDRLKLGWRCRLRWQGEDFPRVIEQQAYAKVIDGKIAVMDILCSGFRPAPGMEVREAA